MIKAKGFTLIELVVVIVILGIISAVATPRFIDLDRDARIASLETVEGAILSATELTYSKAIIIGANENDRSSRRNPPYFEIAEQPVELKYGFPESRSDEFNSIAMEELLDLSAQYEVCYGSNNQCTAQNSSHISIGYGLEDGEACYVKYIEPGGTGNPSDTEFLIEQDYSEC